MRGKKTLLNPSHTPDRTPIPAWADQHTWLQAGRQMRLWNQIQTARQARTWKMMTGVNVSFSRYVQPCFFLYTQKTDETNKGSPFVPPRSSDMCWKTLTCRHWPLCFNNNSLDPPKRSGGPDMRRCDSSGAANTIAGFFFWLPGWLDATATNRFALGTMFNRIRSGPGIGFTTE